MYPIIIPLLLLYFISHFEWFNISSILTYGDWWSQGYHTLTSVVNHSFSMWAQDTGFGAPSVDIGMRLPALALAFLTQILHISYPLGQRLIWFFPMILFSVFGSYALFKHLFKEHKEAVLWACLLYNFNVYFLILQISGHMGISMGYAIMPLFILTIIRLTEAPNLKNMFIASLTIFFLSIYEPRIAYIWLGLSIFISLVLRARWTFVIGMLFTFVLLSFYNFLPIFFWWIYTENDVIAQTVFGSQFMSLLNSMAFFHSFRSWGPLVYFSNNDIPLYFWVVPLMAISSFVWGKRTQYLLLFWALTILWIFLTKQADVPLPWFYEWAFKHIPLFNLFRESSKFYLILAMWYSGLVWFFIQNQYASPKKKRVYASLWILVLYSLFTLFPLITKEAGTMFVWRSIPNDYLIFNEYLHRDPNFSRVLAIPNVSRWIDYSDIHPILSEQLIVPKSWNWLFAPEDAQIMSHLEEAILHPYKEPHPESVISHYNVWYILIPTVDAENGNDTFTSLWIDRKKLIQSFEHVSYLHKLELWMQEMVVFQVQASLLRPKIVWSNLQTLQFQKENNTLYTLEASFSESTSIILSQKFSKSWKMYLLPYLQMECMNVTSRYEIPKRSSWSTLYTECQTQNTFFVGREFSEYWRHWLFDAQHTKAYGYANKWILDKKFIKQNFSPEYYKENPDGSIDVRFVIFYEPQQYFLVGCIITFLTILGIMIYLAFLYSTSRNLEKHQRRKH